MTVAAIAAGSCQALALYADGTRNSRVSKPFDTGAGRSSGVAPVPVAGGFPGSKEGFSGPGIAVARDNPLRYSKAPGHLPVSANS